MWCTEFSCSVVVFDTSDRRHLCRLKTATFAVPKRWFIHAVGIGCVAHPRATVSLCGRVPSLSLERISNECHRTHVVYRDVADQQSVGTLGSSAGAYPGGEAVVNLDAHLYLFCCSFSVVASLYRLYVQYAVRHK